MQLVISQSALEKNSSLVNYDFLILVQDTKVELKSKPFLERTLQAVMDIQKSKDNTRIKLNEQQTQNNEKQEKVGELISFLNPRLLPVLTPNKNSAMASINFSTNGQSSKSVLKLAKFNKPKGSETVRHSKVRNEFWIDRD